MYILADFASSLKTQFQTIKNSRKQLLEGLKTAKGGERRGLLKNIRKEAAGRLSNDLPNDLSKVSDDKLQLAKKAMSSGIYRDQKNSFKTTSPTPKFGTSDPIKAGQARDELKKRFNSSSISSSARSKAFMQGDRKTIRQELAAGNIYNTKGDVIKSFRDKGKSAITAENESRRIKNTRGRLMNQAYGV